MVNTQYEEVLNEGLAKIIVPRLERYKRPDGSIEPAWMPVFYNPQAVISRDFTTMFLKTIFKTKNFLCRRSCRYWYKRN